MGNFSLGVLVGTAIGAGMIMAVNPMDKRSMHKAYNRAGKMMRKFNHTLRDWT